MHAPSAVLTRESLALCVPASPLPAQAPTKDTKPAVTPLPTPSKGKDEAATAESDSADGKSPDSEPVLKQSKRASKRPRS
jgi:hypothetical protein